MNFEFQILFGVAALLVAQSCTLPYRRVALGWRWKARERLELANVLPTASLRYSRVQLCATGLRRSRLFVILALLALLLLPLESRAAITFEDANRLYEQGQYREAIAAYEELLRGGQAAPAIYFNLGNAHFKARQIGQAIANYRLAQRLAPRDPDILANLQFARNQVTGGSTPMTAAWRRTLARLTLNEWAGLGAVSLWVWLATLIAGQWRPDWKRSLRRTTLSLGLLTGFFAVCLVLAWHDRTRERAAIVTVTEAVVRYGPLEESQSFYTARDGAELVVLDQKDNWLQVADAQGRAGWLRHEQVRVLPALSVMERAAEVN